MRHHIPKLDLESYNQFQFQCFWQQTKTWHNLENEMVQCVDLCSTCSSCTEQNVGMQTRSHSHFFQELFDVVCVKAFVFSQWQWLFFLLARFGIKVWQLGQAGGPTETARASMGSRGEMELDSWARLDAQGAQEFTRKIQKCYCSSYRMASQTITIGRNTPRKRMQCTDTDSRWLKCIYS